MKVQCIKLDEAEVRKVYPIGDRVPGWFFRCQEQSNNIWHVEGTDLWGRTVGATDSDDIRVLNQCVAMAEGINAQLAAASARDKAHQPSSGSK